MSNQMSNQMSIKICTIKQVKERTVDYEVLNEKVTSPSVLYRMVEDVFDLSSESVEKFGIFTLNTKNKVNGAHIVSVGTINASIVHPREVFKTALLDNANSIIAFHNHPSGDTTPSNEDIDITERLVKAGELLGVKLLDHIIIGDSTYTSMKELGRM